MCLTIAYSKIKKRNLVLIDDDTYHKETLSERPIRQPLIPLGNVFFGGKLHMRKIKVLTFLRVPSTLILEVCL